MFSNSTSGKYLVKYSIGVRVIKVVDNSGAGSEIFKKLVTKGLLDHLISFFCVIW